MDEFSNSELFIITLLQETCLEVEKAGALFDQFEKEHGSSNRKLIQAEVKSWLIRQGIKLTSTHHKK